MQQNEKKRNIRNYGPLTSTTGIVCLDYKQHITINSIKQKHCLMLPSKKLNLVWPVLVAKDSTNQRQLEGQNLKGTPSIYC